MDARAVEGRMVRRRWVHGRRDDKAGQDAGSHRCFVVVVVLVLVRILRDDGWPLAEDGEVGGFFVVL